MLGTKTTVRNSKSGKLRARLVTITAVDTPNCTPREIPPRPETKNFKSY